MDTMLNGLDVRNLEPEPEDTDQDQDQDQIQDQDQDQDQDTDRPGDRTKDREPTEVERLALSMNWDPTLEKTAEEFIRDLDQVHREQRKRIRQKDRQHEAQMRKMRQQLDDIQGNIRSQREAERAREIQVLERQRKQAFEEQDEAQFQEADRRLRELERGQAPGQTRDSQSQQPEIDPRVQAWKEKNPWYDSGENPREKHMADAVYAESLESGFSVTECLQAVDEELKYFRSLNTRGQKPKLPTVGGGRPGSGLKPNGKTVADLQRDDPQAYEFMRAYVKAGTPDKNGKPMTPEAYIKDYYDE